MRPGIRDIPEDHNALRGLTEGRKNNTDSVMITAFCLTKDELFSRFYIKINNGNTFNSLDGNKIIPTSGFIFLLLFLQ